MELKINDKVKVINSGHSYSEYTEIAEKMSLTNFKKGSEPVEEEIYKIIKTENHAYFEDVIIYALESDTGEHFLINKNGLQLIKSFKGYRLNPDYFNDFIFLALMNNILITNVSLDIDDKRIIDFLKEKNLLDVWTKSIYKEEKPDISYDFVSPDGLKLSAKITENQIIIDGLSYIPVTKIKDFYNKLSEIDTVFTVDKISFSSDISFYMEDLISILTLHSKYFNDDE